MTTSVPDAAALGAVHIGDLTPHDIRGRAPESLYAKTLAHSRSPFGGTEIFTHEVRFPRSILSEFNTHHDLAKNSASTRAIPLRTQIRYVREDPFVPWLFPVNRSGMAADYYFLAGSEGYELRREWWLRGLERAIETAEEGLELGVHKQTSGRVLEPYLWHTVITTGTDWENFFRLRIAPDAQPEIQAAAVAIQQAQAASTATELAVGDWHLPLVGFPGDEALGYYERIAVSIGRCARVSYLTHAGIRDVEADVAMGRRLWAPGHASPFEHPATPMDGRRYALAGFASARYVLDHRMDAQLGAYVAG